MPPVDTTASTTRAWTRRRPERDAPRGAVRRRVPPWAAWWLGLWLALSLVPALAREPEVLQNTLRRSADGAQLSVRLGLEPSPAVEDALLKGVPVYFVWQADVVRERWYWTDKRISQVTRTVRLAYQPLTRRWRVSYSSDSPGTPAAGIQYPLHQNHDTLADALAGVSRVAGWQIAEPGRLDDGVRYTAQWRFRLDLSLLPRPFQIGMANQPGWDVEVQRSLEVPSRNEPEGATMATEAR